MKETRSKKKMPKEISASLITLTIILITLGVTLPLHFIFPDKLTVYWVIAICAAVISPFALANFKIYAEAKGNYTEEQKKAASGKIGLAMLSVWYVDFTFICMFMDWLVAFFVLAGLYLIKMVYDVAKVLVNRKDSATYPNFIVVGDFVLCFLLMILLIYKIPDANLQTIVTALAAALIGGLLTLLGVMLTIKKSDKDRKEDEIKKAKPIFSYNMLRKAPTLDFTVQRVCFTDSLEPGPFGCDAYVELENSNQSVFELSRLYHDGRWVGFEGNKVVLPNSKCYLNFRFTNYPEQIFLEIRDPLENLHYYQLKVLLLSPNQYEGKFLHTVREIESITKEEMEKRMKEAK